MAEQELPTFNVGEFVTKVLVEVFKPENAGKFSKVLQNAGEEQLKTVVGGVLNLAGPIALSIGRGIIEGEGQAQQVMDDLAMLGIRDLLGVDAGGAGVARRGGASGRKAIGNAVGAEILRSIAGPSTHIEPSTAQAERYLGTMASFAIEGWLEGWIVEFLTSLLPGVGNIETFAELDDIMANVMGFGRLSRRVLSPLIDATTVTPMEWHVNKTYRHKLLSAGEVARQVARGRWTREKGIEELARQGYSNDRIEALLLAAEKVFSPSDVRTFVGRGHWTRDQGIAHLKDQGYTEDKALDALRLEGLRRFDELETQEANALVSAYANRDIDRAQFGGMLADLVQIDTERALFTEKAELLRSLNVKRLTISQVEQMVKSGVLSVIDYRNAARREGYPEDDVLALELQLRYEIDEATELREHRRQAAEDRALEQTERDAAAAARKAAVEADRAARARGPLSKLERAAVLGLIPFSRLEEVLAHDYDPDTVAILLDVVEAERAAYLEREARAAEAEKRAPARGLSVSDMRAAVRAGVLTLAEFRAGLVAAGLDAGDADVLTATLAAQIDDRADAQRLREAAAAEARKRSIDLGRFEQLVRRGARTLGQYDAQLAALGFDDVDRAAMVDLLQLQIADDAAARAQRDTAGRELAARGLSLDQFERAVILGVKTLDEYSAFLLAERFTADASVALRALLEERVTEANAARARRTAQGDRTGQPDLPLATLRRAARLGVISPNAYAARLARDGYNPDDVAIDLELLLLEIAEIQAQRQRRAAAERDAQTRNLSLAQVEQAVKRGLAALDDYRARAAQLGYAGDDLELLVELLADEVQQLTDARRRRDVVAGELATRQLNLSQLEEAVKKGLKSVGAFYADVTALGYGADDAELLTALLVVDLVTATSTSEG
jgi:hypothetical protein